MKFSSFLASTKAVEFTLSDCIFSNRNIGMSRKVLFYFMSLTQSVQDHEKLQNICIFQSLDLCWQFSSFLKEIFWFFFLVTKSNCFRNHNMLIKYRSKVVHSATNVRCLKRIGKVVGRPLIHTRYSFTFKHPLSKWSPTICDNGSLQMMNVTGMIDIFILLRFFF